MTKSQYPTKYISEKEFGNLVKRKKWKQPLTLLVE